jgi:hypothetical protein
MESRTRPGAKPPNDNVAALRALRKATRDYLVVLDAGFKALDQVASANPELVYLRTALAIATGRRGSAFGTPHGIETMITGLLGESVYTPEEGT